MRAAIFTMTLIPALALAQLEQDIDLTSAGLSTISQKDPRWAPFAVGPADKVDFSVPPAERVTIGRCGCFLTSLGMSADYMLSAVLPWFEHTQLVPGPSVQFTSGYSYSPKYLDDYFNRGPARSWATGWGFHPDSGGRTCGVVAHPWAASGIGVDAVSKKAFGVSWKEYGNGPVAFARIDEALKQGRPVLVNRRNSTGGRHFNLIVGWDLETQRYLIWDPMWSTGGRAQTAGTGFFEGATDEERYEKWKQSIVVVMPLRTTTPHFLLYFQDDPEPIELGVIDPAGRRTGFDPRTGKTSQENLDAWYSVDESLADPLGLFPPAAPIRTLTVDDPERGTYGLEVYGTGNGAFTVKVGTAEGGPSTPSVTLTGTITAGEVKRFEVHLPEAGALTTEEVPAFFPRARAGAGVVAFVSDDVPFDGRGSYEIGGALTAYEWDFGDGTTASGAQVTHAYADPGTYTAKLSVRNAAGLSGVSERRVLIINPAGGETVRASVSATGAEGDGGSSYPSLSADGRFVAFQSYAYNLVPNDTNGSPDIFVKDLTTNAIERVSVTSSGDQAEGGYTVYGSAAPDLSADGRYVTFHSDAPNLAVDAVAGVEAVYVHDRLTGVTEAVSRDADGGLQTGRFPSISDDGRVVAFESPSSFGGLAPLAAKPHVFVRDRQANTTTWASRTLDGGPEVIWYAGSLRPEVSGDGRFVTFDSDARNLVANDVNGDSRDVFVRDLTTGALSLVSVRSNGEGVSTHSAGASISSDGRYVSFHSSSNDYDATDTNATYDVFVHDRQLGTTTLVSRNSLGEQADRVSVNARLSPNGRFISFFSRGTNLAPSGADVWQAYVRDLQTGQTSRVSMSTAGVPAAPDVQFVEEGSWAPRLSNEGAAAFLSTATNLVANDGNRAADIFVRRSASGSAATTPVANLGGPYAGWATGVVPSAVRFDASGSRDPKGRALTPTWDFGDGSPETTGALVATHAYARPGRFTVKLRVNAGSDVSATVEGQVEVLEPLPPAQLFLVSCAAPGSELVVRGAAPAAQAALVATGWDRGAGAPALGEVTVDLPWTDVSVPLAMPGLTFETLTTVPQDLAAGAYAVSIAGGAAATLTVPCPAASNRVPLANAGGPVYAAVAGVGLLLDGSASSDPEGAALTYTWDFGDGTSGSGVTPEHVYEGPGEFLVTLVVNDGAFDSPTTAGTHSFALVTVTEASVQPPDAGDGGTVPPPGCGCTGGLEALVPLLGLVLFARRRASRG